MIGSCKGELSLETARRVRVAAVPRRARKLLLGISSFSIPAGSTASVKVKLSRKGRRVVFRLKRVRAKAIAVWRDPSGEWEITASTVTLRAQRGRL
jgi:hypothetical protein